MKRLAAVLFVLVLLIPAYVTSNAQIVEDIPLEGLIQPGNNPHSPAIIPVSAFLIPSTSVVGICSNSYAGNALVLIENVSTGADTMEEVCINTVPVTLPLSGPGEYSITITLASGMTYQGDFSYIIN